MEHEAYLIFRHVIKEVDEKQKLVESDETSEPDRIYMSGYLRAMKNIKKQFGEKYGVFVKCNICKSQERAKIPVDRSDIAYERLIRDVKKYYICQRCHEDPKKIEQIKEFISNLD